MHGAVVGAGIAGIASAQGLRRQGISVELFEESLTARATGYQLNVLANGMYALAQIGLLAGLHDSGCGAEMRSAPILDGLTGSLVRSFAVPGVGTDFAPRSFYRGDLHRALLGALEGPAPECSQRVVSISDDPDRPKVVVNFSDGSDREFDFVVGADGAYSVVRGSLFPEHAGYVPRFDGLLFAAHISLDGTSKAERLFAEQVRQGAFVQLGAPGAAVVLSCAGASRFGIIVGLFDRGSGREVSTREEARAIATTVVGEMRDPRVRYAIDHATWEDGNPLVWRVGDIEPLPRFHVGRVALVGDAAHAMIPVVGQGANQSFEDAMILAQELSRVVGGSDLPKAITAALGRYSDERQPHVARVQMEARRRLRAMVTQSRIAHRIGNVVLRLLPQRLFDRFDDHILKYAIRDVSCPIGRQR